MAKFFVEIPTLLFGIIIFWLAKLNPSTFGYFLLILGYHNVIAITLGLCLSSFASTPEQASGADILHFTSYALYDIVY